MLKEEEVEEVVEVVGSRAIQLPSWVTVDSRLAQKAPREEDSLVFLSPAQGGPFKPCYQMCPFFPS